MSGFLLCVNGVNSDNLSGEVYLSNPCQNSLDIDHWAYVDICQPKMVYWGIILLRCFDDIDNSLALNKKFSSK